MPRHFLGIDVGTGSAWAGVLDAEGRLLGSAKRDIALFTEPGEIAEQSSEDIRRAVCGSVREAVTNSTLAAPDIAGIGFDATCSRVAVGPGGTPLPVGRSGDSQRNIIVWTDHRASIRPGASMPAGMAFSTMWLAQFLARWRRQAPVAERKPARDICRGPSISST